MTLEKVDVSLDGQALKRLRVNLKGPQGTPQERIGPILPKLLQRRVLVGVDLPLAWVDDDGSCSEANHPAGRKGEGLPRTPYHRYRDLSDGQDRMVVIFCPASLTESEWGRVLSDIPAGHVRAQLPEFRRQLKVQRAAEGMRSAREARRLASIDDE